MPKGSWTPYRTAKRNGNDWSGSQLFAGDGQLLAEVTYLRSVGRWLATVQNGRVVRVLQSYPSMEAAQAAVNHELRVTGD